MSTAGKVLRLVVPGDPVPQGNMRAFAQGGRAFVTSTNPGPLARYRSTIWDAFDKWAVHTTVPFMEGPVMVDVDFAFRRPQSHFLPANKKRPVRQLRADAPRLHTQKPDIDKLLRATLDALTGRAYADDAQVARVFGSKHWDEASSTTITLKEVI